MLAGDVPEDPVPEAAQGGVVEGPGQVPLGYLPDEVLDRYYSRPERDEAGIDRLIKAQATGSRDLKLGKSGPGRGIRSSWFQISDGSIGSKSSWC